MLWCSAVDSGGAGGARAPLEFVGSEKGQSLISAYQSLAIAASTSGFEKLSVRKEEKKRSIMFNNSKTYGYVVFWET